MNIPLPGSGTPIARLVTPGILILVAMQFSDFMSGYRLTADDALFFELAREGFASVWQAAAESATYTGRIGHYLMTPLNALGSLMAGNVLLRALMVAGHFALMALFCHYVTRLIVGRCWVVTAGMWLCLLAANVLQYLHMPPSAYPLQNTLPFLVLLGIRLWLWEHNRVHRSWQVMLYVGMALAIWVSEFAFLFATALMALEYSVRLARSSGWQEVFAMRRFRMDVALITITLSVYIGFRLLYPSHYPGNTPDGAAAVGRVLLTVLYHAASGTFFYQLPRLDLSALLQSIDVLALVVGVITTGCVVCLWPRLPRLSWLRLIGLVMTAVLFMSYFSLPLAVTHRAQVWCLESGDCGYLDARVAYLGVGVMMMAVALIARRVAVTPSRQKWTGIVLAVGLGGTATLNHAFNQRMSADMALTSQAWERAQRLACQEEGALTARAARVDPENRVSMHPSMNREAYWITFMMDVRKAHGCAGSSDP